MLWYKRGKDNACSFVKYGSVKFLMLFLALILVYCDKDLSDSFIPSDNLLVHYTGRFDFTNLDEVRFDWSGVQIAASFSGTSCAIILEDGENDYNIFYLRVYFESNGI